MTDFFQAISTAAAAMTPLEIFATVTSALCVFLAGKRKVINYPIGIVGTIAFFFFFWNVGLYSSAILQVFFTAVQFYGWWYWLKGNKGTPPPITRANRNWLIGGGVAAIVGAYALSLITGAFNANMAFADAVIFGLSVVAQFFMDRKKLESWLVWGVVNVLSIYVYGSQGLVLTTVLYVAFLVHAGYGWWQWYREWEVRTRSEAETKRVWQNADASKGTVV
jgi:nicotinamide mononucleotide transporter